MTERAPLSDADIDAISERILDKMLKRLAAAASALTPDSEPANQQAMPSVKKVRPDPKAKPTLDDFQQARAHNLRTRRG